MSGRRNQAANSSANCWLALAAALMVSTVLTLVVSVVTFRLVARMMGQA